MIRNEEVSQWLQIPFIQILKEFTYVIITVEKVSAHENFSKM